MARDKFGWWGRGTRGRGYVEREQGFQTSMCMSIALR